MQNAFQHMANGIFYYQDLSQKRKEKMKWYSELCEKSIEKDSPIAICKKCKKYCLKQEEKCEDCRKNDNNKN